MQDTSRLRLTQVDELCQKSSPGSDINRQQEVRKLPCRTDSMRYSMSTWQISQCLPNSSEKVTAQIQDLSTIPMVILRRIDAVAPLQREVSLAELTVCPGSGSVHHAASGARSTVVAAVVVVWNSGLIISRSPDG